MVIKKMLQTLMVSRFSSCKCTKKVFLTSVFQLVSPSSELQSKYTKHLFGVKLVMMRNITIKKDIVPYPKWVQLPAHGDVL